MRSPFAALAATLTLVVPASALAAPNEPAGITVSVERGANGTHVTGRFSIDASVDAAWSTLTDYDGISRFVTSIKDSHLRPGPVVEQRMTGRIGPFAKRIYVALAIDESPKRSIAFQDFSRRSFDRYAGSWTIEPGKDGLTVVYELEAEPRFFVPSFIAGPAFRDSVQVLLAQVREEILRRARSPGNS